MYGEDYGYAAGRVVDTIVRVGESPVKVVGVDEHSGVAHYIHLTNGVHNECHLDEMNFEPVPLGYVNYDGRVHYICRVPKRRDWRQGMRHNNVFSFGADSRALSKSSVSRTIKGEFPTFKECLLYVNEGGDASKAWHRHWAINHQGELLYKFHEVVGTVENGIPMLDDKFNYLEEYFQQCLN